MRLALAVLALVSLPAAAQTTDADDFKLVPDAAKAPHATDPGNFHPDDDLIQDDAALDELPKVRYLGEEETVIEQNVDTTPPARSPAGDIQVN